jgi:hypothetical protein
MKQSEPPPGWDSERVKRVLAYYESQSEEEAVAEDEAAYEALGQTVTEVPTELVPAVLLEGTFAADTQSLLILRKGKIVYLTKRYPSRAMLGAIVVPVTEKYGGMG